MEKLIALQVGCAADRMLDFVAEAEMETWNATRDASADWAAYLEASRKAAEYLGGSLSRDLKSWGPATSSELAGK